MLGLGKLAFKPQAWTLEVAKDYYYKVSIIKTY